MKGIIVNAVKSILFNLLDGVTIVLLEGPVQIVLREGKNMTRRWNIDKT